MMKNIVIVGTSHISKESISEIENKFVDFKPDIIAVELDKQRLHALLSKKPTDKISPSIILKIGVSGFLFLIIGKYLQKKLASIVGVDPGADMMHAVNLARKNKLQLVLIDQDMQITLRRFSKYFTFKEKLLMIRDLVVGSFSRNKIKIDISKVPKKQLITKLLKELKVKYPNLYSVLVDERNKYMAKKLFHLSRQNFDKKILCVVGAGHLEGLKEDLKKLYYSNISLNIS